MVHGVLRDAQTSIGIEDAKQRLREGQALHDAEWNALVADPATRGALRRFVRDYPQPGVASLRVYDWLGERPRLRLPSLAIFTEEPSVPRFISTKAT